MFCLNNFVSVEFILDESSSCGGLHDENSDATAVLTSYFRPASSITSSGKTPYTIAITSASSSGLIHNVSY